MNLAVLIVLPPPSFPGLLELLLLVVVDVCLCLPGLGWYVVVLDGLDNYSKDHAAIKRE
jgi:hypothetical protein